MRLWRGVVRQYWAGEIWRRVPESNRSSRICNPSNQSDLKEESRKHPPAPSIEKSNTYNPSVNENAGPAAREFKQSSRSAGGQSEALIRRERAALLARTIGEAHPTDARALMTAALIDLSEGMPPGAVFGSIREDARFWAGLASEAELFEVTRACLENLRNRAMHLDMRKRLLRDLFLKLPEDTKSAFLDWANGEGDQC